MGYRENFFNNTPSIMGKYQCVKCGGWFSKGDIDVDHKISKRYGGTDDLYNLQATCKHCNRSKRERSDTADIASSIIGAGISGLANNGIQGSLENLGRLGKSVATQKVKDALGIKYRRK